MIGERIKQRRIALGLSLDDLASRTGNFVSKQAIHKYEQGASTPGSDVLIKLAEALGVKVEFFFRPQEQEVVLGEPAYRKHASASAKELKALSAKTQELLERYFFVESVISSHRSTGFSAPARTSRKVRKIEDAERLSLALRKRWKLGVDPIENVTEVFEDRGVKVILLEGNDTFDGLSCWANEAVPVIAIRSRIPGDRQRFSLAHELAHLLMDLWKDVDAEKAAHRFAGSFLVPGEAAFQELGPKRRHIDVLELAMLKRKYGMSMQAWIYRAQDLQIISKSYASSLFALFRKNGWDKVEPGEQLPHEEPKRMERLVLRAASEGVVSPARAAELLGESLNQFRKRLGAELVGREAAAGC